MFSRVFKTLEKKNNGLKCPVEQASGRNSIGHCHAATVIALYLRFVDLVSAQCCHFEKNLFTNRRGKAA